MTTKVADVMTRGVCALTPDDSMLHAAQAMEALDVGGLPVCDGDRLVGMVTDRDLVLRGLAQGHPADSTRLDELITGEVEYCHEQDSLDEVLHRMGESSMRRLPVLDGRHRLIGMLTLGDVAAKAAARMTRRSPAEASPPGPRDGSSPPCAARGAGADGRGGDPGRRWRP